MAKITKITIETDLYHREYKFSVDGMDATTGTYLPQNDGDFLGNFWGAGIGLGGFCKDLNEVHSATLRVSHSLIQRYWSVSKDTFNEDKKELIGRFDNNFKMEDCDQIIEDEYNLFLSKLQALSNFLKKKDSEASNFIEPLEIKIYCGGSPETFLNSLQESKLYNNAPILKKICEDLHINISLINSFEELLDIDNDSPHITILTEKEKKLKAIRDKYTNKLIFVKSINIDVLEVDEYYPAFWFVKDDSMLVELIHLYLDFYFFRYRFQYIWEKIIEHLYLESITVATKLISIGIRYPVYIFDATSNAVVVHNRYHTACKKILPWGSGAEKNSVPPVCKNADYDNDSEEVSFISSQIGPHSITLTVGNKENYIYQYDGTKLKKYVDTLIFTVTVESDGYASGIKIIPISTQGFELRSNRWTAVVGTKISFKIQLSVPLNGKYNAEIDPISCFVDRTPIDIDNCSFMAKNIGCVEILARTKKSACEDCCLVTVLPHADAIRFDIGQTGVDAKDCFAEYESEQTGLKLYHPENSKAGNDRRVKGIKCFEGSEFLIDCAAVLHTAMEADVWEKSCRLQLDNPGIGEIHNNHLYLKTPGKSKLLVLANDEVAGSYVVDFSVLADKSKMAQKLLISTCGIGLLTTLCWYGLNFFTFILYLLCPISVIYVKSHKENHIRTKAQKICLFVTAILSILFFLKAFFEEIA